MHCRRILFLFRHLAGIIIIIIIIIIITLSSS